MSKNANYFVWKGLPTNNPDHARNDNCFVWEDRLTHNPDHV